MIDPVGNHISGKDSDSRHRHPGRDRAAEPTRGRTRGMVFGVRHLTEKECKQRSPRRDPRPSAWVQVPRAVLAVARDDEDPTVTHIQCVAGNRLPAGTPGRMFRIEGVACPDSRTKSPAPSGSATPRRTSKRCSATAAQGTVQDEAARELILDILENEGRQESDALDARRRQRPGSQSKTVRNIRNELANAGLVKRIPDKDENGTSCAGASTAPGAPNMSRALATSRVSHTLDTGYCYFSSHSQSAWTSRALAHSPTSYVRGTGSGTGRSEAPLPGRGTRENAYMPRLSSTSPRNTFPNRGVFMPIIRDSAIARTLTRTSSPGFTLRRVGRRRVAWCLLVPGGRAPFCGSPPDGGRRASTSFTSKSRSNCFGLVDAVDLYSWRLGIDAAIPDASGEIAAPW